ncbi:lytic transglycosylase domain-containing protein, partial [Thermodesulfobacteriota bacterium]
MSGPSARCEPVKKLEASQFPSLISSIRIDAPLDFCGEKVPLDNPEVRERLEKELLLTLWNRSQVILWLKRASRYFPHMEKVLKENHAPDDLKYVPVIESSLRPHAVSPKQAVGFWQFLKSTGRRYDLTITANIDERRNVFASTRAAVKYFKDLYELLGSWTLSAAAYNMGEKGLQAEILTQKNSHYYHLYLP